MPLGTHNNPEESCAPFDHVTETILWIREGQPVAEHVRRRDASNCDVAQDI
jgi:hypothetical protein